MKFSPVKLFLLLPFLLVTGCASGPTTSPSSNEDFWAKVTIALISAFLSFLGALGVNQIRQRKEPRKQLSYELETIKGLVSIQESAKDKITILYNGQNAANLFHVSCNLINSGNTILKNQYLFRVRTCETK